MIQRTLNFGANRRCWAFPLAWAAVIAAGLLAGAATTPQTRSAAATEPKDIHGSLLPPGAVARLGTTLYRTGTGGYLERLQFSADGTALRAGLVAWNFQSGETLDPLPLPKNTENLRFLALSGDEQLALYTAVGGHALTLLDAQTGKVIRQLDGKTINNWPRNVAFSRNNEYAAVIDDTVGSGAAALAVWNLGTGAQIIATPLGDKNNRVTGVSFSPDGKLLAATGTNGLLRVLTIPDNQEFKTLDTGDRQIMAPHFLDKNTLCAGGASGVFVWKLDEAKPALWKANTRVVYQIASSADGKFLAAATWKGLAVFDTATGKPLVEPDGSQEADETIGVAFSADDRALVLGRSQGVELLEVGSWKPARPGTAHTVTIQSTAVSPDGKTLATGDVHGEIHLWDAKGKPLAQWHGHGVVNQLAIAPDGKTVASSQGLWDVATGKQTSTFPNDADRMVRFVDNGKQVLAISAETISWYPIAGGAMTKEIKAQKGCAILYATLSADGSTLVWSETDRWGRLKRDSGESTPVIYTAHVYDLASEKELTTYLVGSQSLALSPDGKQLAVGESFDFSEKSPRQRVTIRETATGKVLHEIPVVMGFPSLLEWSPDGRMLATEFRDNIIRVYNTTEFKFLGQFAGHTHYIQSMRWFSDSKKLVSAGYDTTGLIWAIDEMPKPAPKGVGTDDSGSLR